MTRAWILLVTAAACASAPESPTWVDDVQPVLLANCARCHRGRPIGGAPADFRLDVYEDTVVDGRLIRGAATMAEFVAERAGRLGEMPPDGPELTPRQRQILENWWASRPAGERPALGERPGNRAPTVTVLRRQLPTLGDPTVLLELQIDDADGDSPTGALFLGDRLVWTRLHGGRQTIVTSTAGLPPEQEVPVQAFVSDDLTAESVVLAQARVSAETYSPSLVLTTSLTDAILADRDSPVRVSFIATEPNMNPVIVEAEAVRGDEVIPVGVVVIDPDPAGDVIEIDTTLLPEGPNWRLRVRASGGPRSTTVETGPFVVSHRTTTATWDDVEPILVQSCAICHPGPSATGPARVPNATWVALSYEDVTTPTGEIRRGVHAMRGPIWRRTFQKREMPPRSAATLLPPSVPLDAHDPAALARLEEWLLAGAPP